MKELVFGNWQIVKRGHGTFWEDTRDPKRLPLEYLMEREAAMLDEIVG